MAARQSKVTVRAISGPISIVTGSLGLIAVIGAKHGESFRGTASAYLLTLADRIGFIRNPDADSVAEVRAPGLLSFTDETALQAILLLGICLGVIAMSLAVHASFRREESLYLSAGLIGGWLALVVANYPAGMLSLLVGAALVFVARRERNT